jgi:S1-C subfamily serine protease
MLVAAIVVFALVVCAMPASVWAAGSSNELVNAARNGVLQVIVTYTDENNNERVLQQGSGFLIGVEAGANEIVITNKHVVTLDEETLTAANEIWGKNISNDIDIKVIVTKDVRVDAEIINSSDRADMAILQMAQPISERTPLKIADSDEVSTPETVYALGFPFITGHDAGMLVDWAALPIDDVNVTSGIVSQLTQKDGTDYIQHESKLSDGNSGGPLINEGGDVIGLNQTAVSLAGPEYYYSIASNDITNILDTLGIDYTPAGGVGVAPEPAEPEDGEEPKPPVTTDAGIGEVDKSKLESAIAEAEAIDPGSYQADSYELLSDELVNAGSVMDNTEATQEEVDSAVTGVNDAMGALIEKTGLDMIWIIMIAAVAVVVAVVLLLVSRRKKKALTIASRPVPPQQLVTPMPQAPQSPQAPPMPPKPPYAPPEGGAETSVLNEGAGETTLLSSQIIPRSTITRLVNGESAILNKPLFKIGKERGKVDFCVANNNSISRIHAIISCKDGSFYITDQNATNGTYVNGNKISAGQDVKLNAGDKIKLADEEFDFRM